MARVLPALAEAASVDHASARQHRHVAHWPHGCALIPNLDDWQPGDVLLFDVDPKSAPSVMVQTTQARLKSCRPPRGEARWTHAALYIGDGLMIESVPTAGVRIGPVHYHLGTRAMLARRLVRGGRPISAAEGWQVVRAAVGYFGQRYASGTVARHLLSLDTAAPDRQAVYCSSLVALAVQKGLRVVLANHPAYRPFFPGALARHPRFVDVDVHWCRPLLDMRRSVAG